MGYHRHWRGQAGLASGYYLQKNGLRFLILEANEQALGSWSQYYDSLNRLPIQTNHRVELVEKTGEIFMTRTVSGDKYLSRTVINATGAFHHPFMPAKKGQEEFQGNILHSSEYRNPTPFVNQRVVVGAGNSAVQIAVELAEVSHTSLAVRRPVRLVKQKIWGQDLHFWIRVLGIDTFPFWWFGRNAPSSKRVIDLGNYKDRLAAGKPGQRPMFISFYNDGVIWPDGTKERVNTVIFATGYRPYLAHLKNTGALSSDEGPLHRAGISTTVPGLYYVGLEGRLRPQR
jgi:putative flavoprotein involved in K+ transport